MLVSFARKIDLDNPICWDYHRSGWKYVVNNLHSAFHNPEGVCFSSHFETSVALETPIKIPWVGFLHNTPFHPEEMCIYGNFDKSLGDIALSDTWRASRRTCRGLFVLSQYVRNWVSKNMFDNVCAFYHPTEFVGSLFDIDSFLSKKRRTVVSIGHWMRRFDSFEKLDCDYEKLMLLTPNRSDQIRRQGSEVIYRRYLSDEKYDRCLTKSIVFADLFDSSANNVVIECIVRNTPILINRLPALEEYLGSDYPFFFDDLSHAERMISDDSAILKAHSHLKSMDKSFLSMGTFLRDFHDSEIYRQL